MAKAELRRVTGRSLGDRLISLTHIGIEHCHPTINKWDPTTSRALRSPKPTLRRSASRGATSWVRARSAEPLQCLPAPPAGPPGSSLRSALSMAPPLAQTHGSVKGSVSVESVCTSSSETEDRAVVAGGRSAAWRRRGVAARSRRSWGRRDPLEQRVPHCNGSPWAALQCAGHTTAAATAWLQSPPASSQRYRTCHYG